MIRNPAVNFKSKDWNHPDFREFFRSRFCVFERRKRFEFFIVCSTYYVQLYKILRLKFV